MPSKQKSQFPRLAKSEPKPKSKPKARRATRAKKSADIYVIRITLLGSKPPIWRRIAIPADMKLSKLHDVVQIVMGWHDCHMHEFLTPDGTRYGAPDPEFGLAMDVDALDERKVRLRNVVQQPKDRFRYDYDFGDDWEHGLELQKIVPPDPDARYPVCLAGKRACPPEDCGGIWGYMDLIEALRDPKHERREELTEWIGGEFDPEAFDLDGINALLRRVR